MRKCLIILFLSVFFLGTTSNAEEKISHVKNPLYSNFKSMEKVASNEVDHIAYGYSRFKAIEKFGSVHISLLGSAERIGLNADGLTDYLILRFKNSFAGIELRKPTVEEIIKDSENLGYVNVRVWTIGDDYPIACHIQIIAGIAVGDGELYQNELLGYDSKETIHGSVKETISKLVDSFAISFFKARGEQ